MEGDSVESTCSKITTYCLSKCHEGGDGAGQGEDVCNNRKLLCHRVVRVVRSEDELAVLSDLASEPSAIIYSTITIGGMEMYLHCHSAKRLGIRTVSHNLQHYNHRRNGNLSPLSQC